MQQGLHMGLGCWISTRGAGASRPLLPALPIALRLPSAVEEVSADDLARRRDLSLHANRAFGAGCLWDAGPAQPRLWERHEDVLRRMVPAVSALPPAERQRLADANALLYDLHLQPTLAYRLYLEHRQNHRDLTDAGAAPDVITQALLAWRVQGFKEVIENALAVQNLLTRTSSVVTANQDVLRMENERLTSGADVVTMPTFYSPVSAADPSLWLEADLDLDALESTVTEPELRPSWDQFRARKIGSVRFRFAVIELQRPWFTPSIYAARDWRLPAEDPQPVADGLGRTGLLSAYVSHLYLAQVLDVRVNTPPSPVPTPSLPGPILRPPRSRPDLLPRKPPLQALQMAAIEPVATRGLTRSLTAAQASGPSAAAALAGPSRMSILPDARLSLLASPLIQARLDFAAIRLTRPGASAPPPASSTQAPLEPIYLVGLGRTALPPCPDPDPRFQWT